MQLFDTYVQKLKYKVLREVARHDYHGSLQDSFFGYSQTDRPWSEKRTSLLRLQRACHCSGACEDGDRGRQEKSECHRSH